MSRFRCTISDDNGEIGNKVVDLPYLAAAKTHASSDGQARATMKVIFIEPRHRSQR
jgi:hypothetical protein